VFTANAGVVRNGVFVPARFRHPERQPESAFDVAWFTAHGYAVRDLPDDVFHEGAGDALGFGDVLFSGYRFRSDAAAHGALGAILGVEVLPVELVDDALYHFDLTFCALDERRAIVAPSGWDAYGARLVASHVPEPLVLEPEEARAFCANSVVVGDVVIMAACPARIGRALEAWGFTVEVCDVSEFLKAGGACKCLTLAL
jgi:N-dimethylarginine dimethylaminohydrolase